MREAVAYDEHLLPIAQRLVKLCPDDSAAVKLIGVLEHRANPAAADPTAGTVNWPVPPAKSAWRFPIQPVDRFQRIDTTQLQMPQFTAEPGNFCVAAGLALQALQQAFLTANLAPREKTGVLGLLKSRKPRPTTAWGIDLGRCALKAIKLGYVAETDRVVALEAETIIHDGIANRPTAELQTSIEKTLQSFLDRHVFKDGTVAVSLPAQKVLMRFFSLPLADKKKISEIMHYEVKQQIPFPLETIAWDYQVLESTDEQPEPDCVPDNGIALLAIKLEEVHAQLKLFADRRIKVDVVQSDSAALLNFLMREQRLAAAPQSAPADAPIRVHAILDIGTDSSNIVLTNGRSLAMRSIPLGGNDFTLRWSSITILIGSRPKN